MVVAFLSISCAFAGLAGASFSPNYVDLAPRYAGLLHGICDTFQSAGGFIVPLAVGALIKGLLWVFNSVKNRFISRKRRLNLTLYFRPWNRLRRLVTRLVRFGRNGRFRLPGLFFLCPGRTARVNHAGKTTKTAKLREWKQLYSPNWHSWWINGRKRTNRDYF